MKNLYNKIIIVSLALLFFAATSKAQQNDELINLLIQKNVISQQDADSLRADLAIKAQDQREKQTKFNITAGKALQLSGYIQGRYQINDELARIDGSDIRRARLDLRGVITERWDYRLQLDFAGAPKIIDATIGYKYNDLFKLSAGQLKVPFSLENLVSSNKLLESIDRSQVVEALVARGRDVIGNHNGRDIGLQLSGSFIKPANIYLFDYSIGIFNGAGINATDNNENKDVVGRLAFHPVAGLDLAANFYNGMARWGTPLINKTRKRTGFDAKYVKGSLSLSTEYIRGRDVQIKKDGWYAQAGYFVLPLKLQLLAKYDVFDPDKNTAENTSAWYSGGVNYSFNTWSKLQLNYTHKEEEGIKLNNNLFSAQLQIQF